MRKQRTPRRGPPKMIEVDFGFSPEFAERIQEAADEMGISFSEFVTRALTKWVAEREAENGGPFPPRPRTKQGEMAAIKRFIHKRPER